MSIDYQQGMDDCREGRPAQSNASDEYNRGYGYQYHLDAVHAEQMWQLSQETRSLM